MIEIVNKEEIFIALQALGIVRSKLLKQYDIFNIELEKNKDRLDKVLLYSGVVEYFRGSIQGIDEITMELRKEIMEDL